MKGKMKKLVALALATIMVLAMGITAAAQTVDTKDGGTASITIKNASKGEKYTVYKLFNATVSSDGGSISYTLMDGKDDPGDYFELNSNGYVVAKSTTGEATLKEEEFKTWAREYGTVVSNEVEAEDGSELVFSGLGYGYYFIDSTQGSNVTVDSTNPNATIYDKNSTKPSPVDPEKGLKYADKDDVSIGDTVTYTVAFNTTNYIGAGEDAEKVTSYIITDTLPEAFLENVNVTSIKVMDGATMLADVTKQFDNDKKISIDWVVTTEGDTKGDSLYKNGAQLVITYTAKVKDTADIAGTGNKNDVTVQWATEKNPNPGSDDDKLTGSETISTYAIALKKVDNHGNALPGAEFSIANLAVKGEAGNYVVTTTDDTNKVTGNLKCDSNGELVIKGVASGDYSVTEEVAPNGYNKLTNPITVPAQKLTETTTNTVKYLDEMGNVTETETTTRVTYTNPNLAATATFVVNMTGSLLPSTGGIGTTIFYVVGGVLVVAAGVLLITKKRMSKNN